MLPAASCCPECGGALSYLGEDAAEQLELMRSAFRVIRTVREKHACTQCDAIVQAPAPSRPIERGIAGPGLLARVLTSKYAGCGAEPLTAVRPGGCMLPAAVPAGRGVSGLCPDRRQTPC
ncbi:IS66 family transposase zinc-finger binding domain-containing protein [Enterobacter ludwigii]|uniref:IS66 family transposase zinc-finger binding domain-containing protein n=1 Tax=Enterobacter ludwigii TaxID=299767 RepID=UPI003976E414